MSLGLNNDQADNVHGLNDELKDKLVISKPRPRMEPKGKCLGWTWAKHNTLKGQFDDHDKVYRKKSKKLCKPKPRSRKPSQNS